MAGVLAPGGLLVVTSRNWELQRSLGSGLRVGEEVLERGGHRGLVAQAWTIPGSWDEPHHQDVVVALLEDDGAVTPLGERLTLWPYPHEDLTDDLGAAGLDFEHTTYAPAARPLPRDRPAARLAQATEMASSSDVPIATSSAAGSA